MKHTKKFRSLAAALAALMAMSACGAAEPISQVSASTASNATSGAASATSSASAQSTAESASTPAGDPVKLTYFVDALGDSIIQSYNENLMYQEVEKLLNIDVEFQHSTKGQFKEQLNVMVSSGNLPDIIENFSYANGPQAAIDEGLILELNDLAEKNAPDFMALLNSDDTIKREVVTDEGTIWSIPCLQPKREPSWRGISLRGDLLEKAGLEKPQTIAEFKTMLTKFKELGVEYPLSFGFGYPNDNGAYQRDGYFVAAYGIGPDWYMDPTTKQIEFGPMQDTFLDFLTEMNAWYSEGLLDPDFATRKNNEMDPFIVNGQVGAFISGYGPSLNFQNNGQAQNPDFKLVQVTNPALKDGEKAQMRNQDSVNKGNATVITVGCENPDAAMKFLNFGFTEQGALMYNYGLEDVSYTLVDGKPEFTPAMTDGSEGAWPQIREKYKKQTGPYNRDWAAAPLSDYEYGCMDAWSEAGTDLMVSLNVSLTSEESSKFNSIMTSVFTYLNENAPAFVSGTRPLSEFEAFRADLENLGLNDALAIKRAAYQRYLDRA